MTPEKQKQVKESPEGLFITEPINLHSKGLAQSLYESVINNVQNELTDEQMDKVWERACSREFQVKFLKSMLL